MSSLALQPDSAWAEDRAMLRSNPSAVPGAKTDGAARGRPVLHSPHRDWHQSVKPSQQNAATSSARCHSQLVNANRSTFQFPLNQDKPTKRSAIWKGKRTSHFFSIWRIAISTRPYVRTPDLSGQAKSGRMAISSTNWIGRSAKCWPPWIA